MSERGVLLGDGVVASMPGVNSVVPSIASNGEDFLVVWTEQRLGFGERAVFAARVAADGSVLDPEPRLLAGFELGAERPVPDGVARVASDGLDYLAVWPARLGASYQTRGSRVLNDGTILDLAAPLASHGWPVLEADVTWSAPDYLVVWTTPTELREWSACIYVLVPDYVHHAENVFGVRLSPSGEPVDPAPIRLTRDVRDHLFVSILSTPSGPSLMWEARACGRDDTIRASAFPTLQSPAGEGQVLEEASVHSGIRLAATAMGDAVIAVWSIDGSMSAEIYAGGGTGPRRALDVADHPDLQEWVWDATASRTVAAIAYQQIKGDDPPRIAIQIFGGSGRARPARR
jgi:hypothetical protein